MMRLPLLAGILALQVLVQNPAWADDPEAEHARAQAELEALQEAIAERRASLVAREEALSATEQALREAEQAVAETTQELQQTARELEAIAHDIAELETEQSRLEQELTQQADLLAEQIESAYRADDYSFLRMLLNQESPARFERLLVYYQYLNEARLTEIAKLEALEEELLTVRDELTSEREQLAATQARQEEQRTQLAAQQAEQEQRLADLQAEQQSEEAQLAELEQNEQELSDLLTSLSDALISQEIELAGLTHIQGQLRQPVQGKLEHQYGDQRSSRARWNGVVWQTSPEAEVHSVADGRVLFAEWLRGYGLVLVIDHGEGYMSLYGYNQALLKDVGESVQAGELVAVAGRSGGRREPGLYFEIRHRGEPLDPLPYLQ